MAGSQEGCILVILLTKGGWHPSSDGLLSTYILYIIYIALLSGYLRKTSRFSGCTFASQRHAQRVRGVLYERSTFIVCVSYLRDAACEGSDKKVLEKPKHI